MVADNDLDVLGLDMDDREKRLIRSLEMATQPFMQKTSGLMIGLTVGNFDCNIAVSIDGSRAVGFDCDAVRYIDCNAEPWDL